MGAAGLASVRGTCRTRQVPMGSSPTPMTGSATDPREHDDRLDDQYRRHRIQHHLEPDVASDDERHRNPQLWL